MKFVTIALLALLALLALSFVAASETELDMNLEAELEEMAQETEWVTPSFVEILETRPGLASGTAQKKSAAPKKVGAAAPKVGAAAPVAASSGSGSPCVRPVSGTPASIKIDASVVALARQKTKAGHYPRGVCGAGDALTEAQVRTFLTAAWGAFGATGATLTDYVNRNVKQIKRESTFCPNILQGIIKGDPNNNNPAGGLFQFIPATFNQWAVKGFEQNRFNPLSNILASVNAQVNAQCVQPACHHRVLSGCAGWTPVKGTNPYKI